MADAVSWVRSIGAAGLGLMLGSGGASAEIRITSAAFPCAAIVAAVNREGAVILDTGPNLFDRIVRDQGFCPIPETTKPTYAPAADTPQCFVGYRCVDKFREQDRAD